ncbi:MAG TPA: amidohydrolase family protein [Syntrophomonas sp.]|nr:amidohydrolase family protein [Syntrophomonas sp.]
MTVDFRVRIPPSEQYSEIQSATEFPEDMRHYVELYGMETILSMDTQVLLKLMEKSDVTHAVLQAEVEFGDYHKVNAIVERLSKQYPEKFTGFITVDPTSGDNALDLIENAVKWGCKGINLEPWSFNTNATDPYYMNVCELARDRNLIITCHASVNFSKFHPIEHSHPLYLDKIACAFPGLKIVANHGGWPWVTEMVAVAWKHPNIYIEFGGVSPKYMSKPGTGWEPMLVYGNSQLKKQLMFATDWPVIDFEQSISEFKQLPLKPEVLEGALYKNAAALLEKDI